MMLAAHRVWVLGNGFLGGRVAAACRESGASVLTLDAVASADVQGEAADETVLCAAARRGHPTLVFYCLSTRGQPQCYESTYLRPLRLLTRLFPSVEIIFCSSLSAAGNEPVFTAEVLRQAEQLVLQRGGRVARLAALYGPGRCELLRRHLAGEPRLSGAETRMLYYVHVEDAVAALLRLVEAAPGTCANVVGEVFSKQDIYSRLEAWTGVPVSAGGSRLSHRGCVRMPEGWELSSVPGWLPRHRFENFVRQEVQG